MALLGRSKPWGTFFAGLLYGGFRAGGVTMQSMTGTNIDIVLVVQSLIVLFIALPPLVRTGQDRVRSRRGGSATTTAATATEGGRA